MLRTNRGARQVLTRFNEPETLICREMAVDLAMSGLPLRNNLRTNGISCEIAHLSHLRFSGRGAEVVVFEFSHLQITRKSGNRVKKVEEYSKKRFWRYFLP